MAKNRIDDLEKKKQELEEQLHKLQGELDESFDKVSSTLNPKKIIQRYPLPIVSASVLLGFLFGRKGNNGKKKEKNTTSTDNSSPSRDFGSALLGELRRLATRKAVTYATGYLEELIENKAEKHLSSDNGEKED